jgi:hypothetical protein
MYEPKPVPLTHSLTCTLQAVRNKNLENKPADKPKQVNLLDLKRYTAVNLHACLLFKA